MRYSAIILVILALLVVFTPARSDRASAAPDHYTKERIQNPEENKDSVDVSAKKLIQSKHERKTARIKSWIGGLEGDKERIYKEYGYPTGRYRVELLGTYVEKWVYAHKGKVFTFKGNKLIRQD